MTQTREQRLFAAARHFSGMVSADEMAALRNELRKPDAFSARWERNLRAAEKDLLDALTAYEAGGMGLQWEDPTP